MGLKKETSLGSINLSNSIFAQLIFDGMESSKCKDKIWPASPKGRPIGIVNKYMDTEFAMYIETGREKGRLILEFSVIVKFGISIKRTTEFLSDYVAKNIEEIIGEKPAKITINIAGIKSRHKVRGKTKVVYRYET